MQLKEQLSLTLVIVSYPLEPMRSISLELLKRLQFLLVRTLPFKQSQNLSPYHPSLWFSPRFLLLWRAPAPFPA